VLASVVALVGVLIMVGPGARTGRFEGAALAFMMTLFLALMIVTMRANKSVSMLPASCLSAFLSSIVVWPITSGAIPAGAPMFHLALFGIVQFGLGLIFRTLAIRHITALRSSLLERLQTVLGPFWVWLAFAEAPPVTTIVGGSIVLVASFFASLIGRDAVRRSSDTRGDPRRCKS